MRRVVVDTNAVIYYLFEDQKLHEKAKTVLNKASEWIIPDVVIHELIWFLRGAGLGDKDAISAVVRVLSDRRASVICPSPESLIEGLLKGIGNWEDEVILIISEDYRAPIVTFDEELRVKALRRGVEVLP